MIVIYLLEKETIVEKIYAKGMLMSEREILSIN